MFEGAVERRFVDQDFVEDVQPHGVKNHASDRMDHEQNRPSQERPVKQHSREEVEVAEFYLDFALESRRVDKRRRICHVGVKLRQGRSRVEPVEDLGGTDRERGREKKEKAERGADKVR